MWLPTASRTHSEEEKPFDEWNHLNVLLLCGKTLKFFYLTVLNFEDITSKNDICRSNLHDLVIY